jgi:hypothetical protein
MPFQGQIFSTPPTSPHPASMPILDEYHLQ